MAEDARLESGVHQQYAAEAVRLGPLLRDRATPLVRSVVAELAQSASRSRDDNHVGTEHLILGLYLAEESRARRLLEAAGVSRDVFESVLDDEPGPSPDGVIPYTVRSAMIGGLAVKEADATTSSEVNDLHLLLGAFAESRRWERQHRWGPHHLRTAIDAAGASADQIEADVRAALSGDRQL